MDYNEQEELTQRLNAQTARLVVFCCHCHSWVSRGLNSCPECGSTVFRDLTPADFIEAELDQGSL